MTRKTETEIAGYSRDWWPRFNRTSMAISWKENAIVEIIVWVFENFTA